MATNITKDYTGEVKSRGGLSWGSRKFLFRVASLKRGYLQRLLGAISNDPLMALTELVANAWDASKVNIEIPVECVKRLSVEDDDTGMTHEEFEKRERLLFR